MIIRSTNPKFSWILRKNPETQRTSNEPFSKALRKGVLYGWFNGEQEFRMFFQDSVTESSFNTISDFEYLDRTRYVSPYLPIAMIATLLASAQKEKVEEDSEGFDHEARFLVDIAKPYLAKRAIRSMQEVGVDIDMVSLQNNLHQITFKSKVGVFHLLNCIISFLIPQSVLDVKNYVPMDDGSIKKYVTVMNNINAPYYLRYMFSMNCIKSPVLFKELRSEMQGANFIMNFGNTQDHRWEAIKPYLIGDKDKDLVDIGCGEMFYTKRVCSQYRNVYAYDIDTNIQEKNAFIKEKRNMENVSLHGKFDSSSDHVTSDSVVLITEVLEHMPIEDADSLLQHVLSKNPNRVIVTMPNHEFNKFYGMDVGAFRHEDHHYEPTETEFMEKMIELGKNNNKIAHFNGIGDGVKAEDRWIYSSLMCVFE